jgi:hypothetical protein
LWFLFRWLDVWACWQAGCISWLAGWLDILACFAGWSTVFASRLAGSATWLVKPAGWQAGESNQQADWLGLMAGCLAGFLAHWLPAWACGLVGWQGLFPGTLGFVPGKLGLLALWMAGWPCRLAVLNGWAYWVVGW